MTLELPYPPSANNYWRVVQGRAVKSREARTYQQHVKLLCLKQRVRPLAGPLSARFVVRRRIKRGDLDNAMKVILDALKGVAFSDDEQVVELYALRVEAPKDAGVSLTVVQVSAAAFDSRPMLAELPA